MCVHRRPNVWAHTYARQTRIRERSDVDNGRARIRPTFVPTKPYARSHTCHMHVSSFAIIFPRNPFRRRGHERSFGTAPHDAAFAEAISAFSALSSHGAKIPVGSSVRRTWRESRLSRSQSGIAAEFTLADDKFHLSSYDERIFYLPSFPASFARSNSAIFSGNNRGWKPGMETLF